METLYRKIERNECVTFVPIMIPKNENKIHKQIIDKINLEEKLLISILLIKEPKELVKKIMSLIY